MSIFFFQELQSSRKTKKCVYIILVIQNTEVVFDIGSSMFLLAMVLVGINDNYPSHPYQHSCHTGCSGRSEEVGTFYK